MFLLTSKTDGARFPPPLFPRAGGWARGRGKSSEIQDRSVFPIWVEKNGKAKKRHRAYFSPGKMDNAARPCTNEGTVQARKYTIYRLAQKYRLEMRIPERPREKKMETF